MTPSTSTAPVPATEVGRHALADLCGIDADLLRDADRVMGALGRILRDDGYHVLNRVQHTFEGGGAGFTGVFLLSESHAAVHSYPEHGYLALDVFGCGPQDPAEVARRLAQQLDAERADVRCVGRVVPG